MYRPSGPGGPVPALGGDTVDAVAFAAATNGDEHAIKFAEVAIESHTRGNRDALPAARTALALIQ
jgi:hypothetical protein